MMAARGGGAAAVGAVGSLSAHSPRSVEVDGLVFEPDGFVVFLPIVKLPIVMRDEVMLATHCRTRDRVCAGASFGAMCPALVMVAKVSPPERRMVPPAHGCGGSGCGERGDG